MSKPANAAVADALAHHRGHGCPSFGHGPRVDELDEYQELASGTGRAWDSKPRDEHRLLLAAGLSGETGEVADNLKKEVGHGHPYDEAKLLEELGDALWYLSEIARKAGFPLSLVASSNVAKVRARYPDGFSERASLERE